jgi:NAD(P)-dependent dehydrogenase (short-subunit alcohol dehydrogenase family)
MNIVILGGGTPNKFGHDFALAARACGHRVVIFSHKKNGLDDPDQHVIDYDDLDATAKVFAQALDEFSQIDIILLNQNGTTYPRDAATIPIVDVASYTHSFNLYVVAGHLLVSKAYWKLADGSKVVYMSTGLAFQHTREQFCDMNHFSYSGYKSLMTHVIMGFAHNRRKKTIFTVLSPHFPYEDHDNYKKVFAVCRDWIFDHDESANGTTSLAWVPDQVPHAATIQVVLKNTNKIVA